MSALSAKTGARSNPSTTTTTTTPSTRTPTRTQRYPITMTVIGCQAVLIAFLVNVYAYPGGGLDDWRQRWLPGSAGLKRNNGGGVAGVKWGSDAPEQAQWVDQRGFNVLGNVPPPSVKNSTTLFEQPGSTPSSLFARPFHIYHPDFLTIIGPNPSLTLIAETSGDPLFHEATVWFPPTDDFYFVQNAGAKAAGTGLAKSAVVQKVSLGQVGSALGELRAQGGGGVGRRSVVGKVGVDVINSTVQVVNPNGGTNYKGQIVFLGEGQGDAIAPAIYQLNPYPPYETKVILDNYFGRQFNALNDVAVNPRNKELYFTDPTYGWFQDFRPAPALPYQVYRFDERTGAVRAVADDFGMPNGITFSPDGKKAYIADTGASYAFFGKNGTRPATVYSFDVTSTGAFINRSLFAHVGVGIPDGVHCDSQGNVYAGVGDGVHVWNPSGVLLGKIYLGETSANFQFAGKGRMVLCAETRLYYVELAAEGAPITDYNYEEILQ